MNRLSDILVLRMSDGDPFRFEVSVKDLNGESRHDVTLTRASYEQLTGGKYAPESCVEAAFRFLLDHEPKESILANFDIDMISHYFPSFEVDVAGYFPQS